jgi:nucleotide-binding universal stress UspA family protein
VLHPKLILSPIDFSDSSLEALDTARDIAGRYGSAILLVHVVPVIPKLPSDVSIFNEGTYEKDLLRAAEQHLTALAEKLKTEGITARTTVGWPTTRQWRFCAPPMPKGSTSS